MKVTELTKQWQCNSERGKSAVTFPYVSPCFGKVDLRICTDVTASRAFLDVDGVSGVADVYVGGECFGTVVGASRRLIPLGNSLGSEGTIGLSLEDGGGITRGVKLHYSDSRTYIRPYGLFVRTESVDGQGAEIVITEKLLTHGDQHAESEMDVFLNGEGSKTRVISRSVAQDNSVQVFYPRVEGNCPCFGHVSCDAIIMGNAKVRAIPEITCNHVDAGLIHEAAIGKIAGDQLLKLMTLGLTAEEAEEKILEGFLR